MSLEKNKIRYYYIHIRMIKNQNTGNTNVEPQELSYTAGRNVKLITNFGRQLGSILQNKHTRGSNNHFP